MRRLLFTAVTTAAAVSVAVAAAPASAARAPLPRLARVGNPPATVAPGSALTARFRLTNPAARTSARATVTVRLTTQRGARTGLPGKAIVPALRAHRTFRGSRRFTLPAAIAPGSYSVVACVKRSGVKAVCRPAGRTLTVPGPAQAGGGSTTTTPPPSGTTTPPPGGTTPSPPPPADTTAPSVTVALPAEGADVDARRPPVGGSAGTAAGDEHSVSVRLTGPGATQTLTAPVDGSGAWSASPTADLAPGRWSAVAEQRDAAGNTGTSAARGFAVSAVLLAGGDIAACDRTGDSDTAALLDSIGGDAVAPLGDLAYEQGTSAEFANCYDPTWGRAKARTRPAIGNHEYESGSPAAYFTYFGAPAGDPAKGYYSYDLGTWHVVVLNSNCSLVACAAGSSQATWLSADLAAHPAACTVAYWHHPLFTSSQLTGPNPSVAPLWDILDAAGADLVLNGHAHVYERLAPQHSNGSAAADGIREIVAGTGGYDHHDLDGSAPNSQAKDRTTFGVLELTLRQNGYRWDFVPAAGGTFTDSGTTACG
jgi:acid phosphatase type 7